MRWMGLALLLAVAAVSAQPPEQDEPPNATEDTPGWRTAEDSVGASREAGDGRVTSPWSFLLVAAALIIAAVAAVWFFASRQ